MSLDKLNNKKMKDIILQNRLLRLQSTPISILFGTKRRESVTRLSSKARTLLCCSLPVSWSFGPPMFSGHKFKVLTCLGCLPACLPCVVRRGKTPITYARSLGSALLHIQESDGASPGCRYTRLTCLSCMGVCGTLATICALRPHRMSCLSHQLTHRYG